MGRSCGGLTRKIPALVETNGLPVRRNSRGAGNYLKSHNDFVPALPDVQARGVRPARVGIRRKISAALSAPCGRDREKKSSRRSFRWISYWIS